MIKLGDRVEDRITKFSGIVWGITAYLHGCNRIHVMPEKLQDGKMQDTMAFDEPQLAVLKSQAYQIENNLLPKNVAEKGKTPGGPAYLNAKKPTLGLK